MAQDSNKSLILKRQISVREDLAKELLRHFGKPWRSVVAQKANTHYDTVKRYFHGGQSRLESAERIFLAAHDLIIEAEDNLQGNGSNNQ